MAKLNITPRASVDAETTRWYREIAQQVNGLSEGKIAASYQASLAAPTTGTYQQGDFVTNSAPAELGTAPNRYVIRGWNCVAAGTPGTWVESRIPTEQWSGGGGVTSVTGTTPVVSSGGATPAISMPAATNAVAGHATAAHIAAIEANTAKVTNATHTGDATGATALTLATVNANVGAFTNANITVNAKGLITAAASGAGASNFPLIKNSTAVAETLTVTAGFQFICKGTFENRGDVINRGEFIVL